MTLNVLKGMKLATVSWRLSLSAPPTHFQASCEPHQRFTNSRIKTNDSSTSHLVNVYCRHPEKTVQAGSTQTKSGRKAQGCYRAACLPSKEETVVFTATGCDSRIRSTEKELVRGRPSPTLGKSSSFAHDFQRHKQEMTEVKLTLQNRRN